VVDTSRLAEAWVASMSGVAGGEGLVLAHAGPPVAVGPPALEAGGAGHRLDRARREEIEEATLSPGATRSLGAGRRRREEEPDPTRTCFEKDRDRIVHSKAFRRLAGKTQVFVFPADHQRTRLTHALEVAQVATAVARATGLNVALAEAIALGHDCGHGPGGHASEAVFDALLDEGFHHARWGADVVLEPLNLCAETLDGIRCHSWSLEAPSTPEGAVVSWADRIAYCTHDLEDAIHAGIVGAEELPEAVAGEVGTTRSAQIGTFIEGLVEGILGKGVVAMDAKRAHLLSQLRAFDYERIYNRPEAVAQSEAVAEVLGALLEHFVAHPERTSCQDEEDRVHAAVRHVDGMTDRYAFETAVEVLGWDRDRLPRGIDVAPTRV